MMKNLSKADMVRGLGAVLLLLFALPAAAAPQLMADYGDQWAWRAGDINAMGGTGVAVYRGGFANIYNPALLALEAGSRVDAGVSVDQESEDRFLPLFDTFGSWVADTSIAANRNHFWQSGFAASRRILDGEIPVSAGLSLTDRYPFQYTFQEELRNPSLANNPTRDMILAERRRELTGTLRDLSLGFGAKVHERVSVGFAAHYAFGTRTDQWSVRDYYVTATDGDSSYTETYTQDLEGINVTFGVHGVVSERVEVGLAWESRLKACGDFNDRRSDPSGLVLDETHAGYWQYPDVYRAGLVFYPRTDPKTVFTIEAEYMPWSQTVDTEKTEGVNKAHLQDTMDVRVGLQHRFYNGVPVRFGFRHYDSYMDKEASGSAFSGGVGIPVAQGLVSVSVELTKLTGVLDHQFPYSSAILGGQYQADPQARVEDTRFRVGASYTLNF